MTDGESLESENVWLVYPLNYDLANLIGQKVWALGFFGSSAISGDGKGFLVHNYQAMKVDEELIQHTYARLAGDIPGGDMDGAELLVFGEVQDHAQVIGDPLAPSVPLITVEEYVVTEPPASGGNWDNPWDKVASFFKGLFDSSVALVNGFFQAPVALAEEAAPVGNKASPCDRALIISGGINADNNHQRYQDNVKTKYDRLRQLGFTRGTIDVLYADGAAIMSGTANTVDKSCTKANIQAQIDKYKNEMQASCTLTIFITDHGTGYNAGQGWSGARPADAGSVDATSGMLYDEHTFSIDVTHKLWKRSGPRVVFGKTFRFWRSAGGKLEVEQRVGGAWVSKGSDANGDNFISEAEMGMDIDGDGTTAANRGFRGADITTWLEATQYYADNSWDTDADGTVDVRARFDGTRYVFERKKADGTWFEMGRDTNGDNKIDGADGGVDWNMDGDKGDKVGFHEGINLWGNEVLWDDEMASMLKPLSDAGVHILIESVCCFAGGLVGNVTGIAEKIVTGSGEDTKHTNRAKAGGGFYAADQTAFMANLHGIDIDSFNYAFDKAVAADEAAWVAEGSNPNDRNTFVRGELPKIESRSTFENWQGRISYTLHIPDELKDKVHDFEIIYGSQVPRWDTENLRTDVRSIRNNLPEGWTVEEVPGGYRMYSADPVSQIPSLWDLGSRGEGVNKLRIILTDKDHKQLGYISPTKITMPEKPDVTSATIDGAIITWDDESQTGEAAILGVATDLTGGDVPIRRVQLYEDGELVYDSGDISATEHEVEHLVAVAAGDSHVYELVVTNDHGQVIRTSTTITVHGSTVEESGGST